MICPPVMPVKLNQPSAKHVCCIRCMPKYCFFCSKGIWGSCDLVWPFKVISHGGKEMAIHGFLYVALSNHISRRKAVSKCDTEIFRVSVYTNLYIFWMQLWQILSAYKGGYLVSTIARSNLFEKWPKFMFDYIGLAHHIRSGQKYSYSHRHV